MDNQVQPSPSGSRWIQLICGIICMAMIANLQYGWTLFVDPIDAKYHWGRAAIQTAFTIFVATETWLVPVEACFVDRYGPRIVVMFGGVMIALAWIINAYASSLLALYAAAVIAGVGAGAVYGTCVGNALKWFPDRRGLAAGATAAGFGAGAAITVVPIANVIASRGYETAFLWFGIGQGVIVFLMSFVLRKPSGAGPVQKRKLKVQQAQIDRTPAQAVRTPVFWVMYAMFVMVASGGLMTAAQIGPIAHDYQIANVPLNLFGLQMAALTLAISLDRVLDGFGRPFFGWVSDNIGRENTMFIAFATAAVALTVMSTYGQEPWIFVLFTASVLRRLRRDLQPVPGHLRRHVRLEVRGHQRWAALHGEGNCGASGPVCELDRGRLRLERRVHDRGGAERNGRPSGHVCPEADAQDPHARHDRDRSGAGCAGGVGRRRAYGAGADRTACVT